MLENAETGGTGFVGRDSWHFAGYNSPEAAVQSLIFSGAAGDFDTFLASLASAHREKLLKRPPGSPPLTKEEFTEAMKRKTEKLVGYRIAGREPTATADKVLLSVEFIDVDGKRKQEPMAVIRDGQEWRMTDPECEPSVC
jgi:hypothetical protein